MNHTMKRKTELRVPPMSTFDLLATEKFTLFVKVLPVPCPHQYVETKSFDVFQLLLSECGNRKSQGFETDQ